MLPTPSPAHATPQKQPKFNWGPGPCLFTHSILTWGRLKTQEEMRKKTNVEKYVDVKVNIKNVHNYKLNIVYVYLILHKT